MKLEGIYGLYHIVYLLIVLLLIIFGLIIIKKKVYRTEVLEIILRILAALLLITIIVDRISTVQYKFRTGTEYNSWWCVLPNSLCSTSSVILSVALLISPKKNNPILYYVMYMGFIGAIVTHIYPDFLDVQAFFELNSITGMLHHSLTLFLVLLIYMEGYFTPSIKKIYIAPLTYIFLILYGLFCITALNVPNSMNILKPLLPSLPILTSWYMLGILFTLFVVIYSLIYDYIHKYDYLTVDKLKYHE